MKVTIETIPHYEQRYSTIGDWQIIPTSETDRELKIKVSDLGDWRLEFLVALHEMVEVALCMVNGVTEKEVDEFDMNYTKGGEPGDDINAPYHGEHVFAGCIERLMANEMGIDWSAYENAIAELG